ncbi:MAG: hypothetical protein V1921_06375 [Candidatus Altiarchaeota archaeon]
MTRTKIVKLKLERGTYDKLPDLRDGYPTFFLNVLRELQGLNMPMRTNSEADIGACFEKAFEKSKGLDLNSERLQRVYDSLKNHISDRPHSNHTSNIWAGLLLTALMQDSSHTDFTLSVNKRLDFMGFGLNGKRITMVGDVGDYPGSQMNGGSITVKGNAGDYVGFNMGRGEIQIEGNASDYAGSCMRGGYIHVKHVGDYAGHEMIDGVITVSGDAGEHTGKRSKGGAIRVGGIIESASRDGMCKIEPLEDPDDIGFDI